MTCPICASADIQEIRCKVICRNCGTILQSCADLHAALPSTDAPGRARCE
jgi:hypothetical protein